MGGAVGQQPGEMQQSQTEVNKKTVRLSPRKHNLGVAPASGFVTSSSKEYNNYDLHLNGNTFTFLGEKNPNTIRVRAFVVYD